MKLLTLFFLFLTANVNSQSLSPDEKMLNYPSASGCGLVTRWASNLIPPECLTEAKNVYFDQDLSISRRNGYVQYNTTPCTDSKSIRGMWNFDATDGQRYIVINSSQSFFYTRGQSDCVPMDGVSGKNLVAQYECVQSLGQLYCTNGIDIPFRWDGSSVSAWGYSNFYGQYLIGSKIATFRNRIVIAGVPTMESRILMSGEGDGTDWNLEIPGFSTSPASIDISGTNDGKSITSLLGQYQNSFYIGRIDDLWNLSGNDRRDFTLRQVSSQIGVIDNRSVKEKDGCLVWLSRRGIERMCGTTIERASDVIKPIVDAIVHSGGNTRTRTFNSENDWESGLYSLPGDGNDKLSTTILPGSVVPSTWTSFNGTDDWNDGTLLNIDSVSYPSYIVMNQSFSNNLFDNLATFTGIGTDGWNGYGSEASPGYGQSNGSIYWHWVNSFDAIGGVIKPYDITFFYSSSTFDLSMAAACAGNHAGSSTLYNTVTPFADTASTPTINGYSLETTMSCVKNCTEGACILKNNSNQPGCQSAVAYLYKYVNGTKQLLASQILSEYIQDSDVCILDYGTLSFSVSSNSLVHVQASGGETPTLDLSYYDSNPLQNSKSFSTQTRTVISRDENLAYSNLRDIYYSSTGYLGTGTFTSKIYDTSFSTPIGGPFYTSDLIPLGSTITYSVRQSTYSDSSGMGSWVLVSSDTSGGFMVPLTQRYWQYKSDFTNPYSTQTPVIDWVALEATTSGYYYTDCVDATGITTWGNFRPLSILSDNSVIDYWVNSGDSCNQVTRSTANWSVQLPNTPIAVSTANFLGIKVFELPTSSTDSTRLDALTIEWNEGSFRPPVASQVYQDRYYLFYTTNTTAGTVNNHSIVMDINNKWSVLDDIYVNSAVIYQDMMFTGDSRDNGLISIQDQSSDDMNNPFDFKVVTGDYDFGNPIERKKLKRIYFTFKSESVVGQDINLSVKYYVDGSSTPYSLSSVDMNEAQQPGYFVAKFPAINTLPSLFHWLKIEVEYNGRQGPLNLYSIRVVYSEQRFD